MSLQLAAQHLASKGRDGDSVLVHMTPGEVRGLQELAVANGGELTINPETGLPEANFLKALLPTIIGAALAPLTAGTSLAFLGTPLGAGLAVGGFEALRTGDLGKGLMAGFGAYGGSNLAGALASAGTSAAVEGARASIPAIAEGDVARLMLETGADKDVVLKQLQREAIEKATTDAARSSLGGSFSDRAMAGLQSLKGEAGRTAFMDALGGAKGAIQTASGIAGPIAAAQDMQSRMPKTVTQMTSPTARVTPYEIDEYGNLRRAGSYTPEQFVERGGFASLYGGPPPGAAGGGLMSHLADGGTPYDEDFAFAQRSEPVVRMANGGTPPPKATREEVLAAYKANPLAELNPNDEAIKHWMTSGLGNFNQVVQDVRAANPMLAKQIDAARAVAQPAPLNLSTAGYNFSAEPVDVSKAAIISGTAPAGYSYADAAITSPQAQQINQLYRNILNRDVEQEGLNYWMNQLKPKQAGGAGLSLPEIEAQIRQISRDIGVKAPTPPVSTPADVTFGGDTVIPPYVAPQPDVTIGTPFQPKAQTMNEVRTAYEQGGGATRMPTITDIRPTDRMYSQGQAVGLIRDYLKSNPNAMYRDVVAFANSRGIPEMQARAAYNEFRFTDMSPGMQGIYDYLMGRGPAPIKPYVPGGGPIMRSYREVMGIPSTYQDLKPVNLTGNQDAVSKGVPKEVPSVKDPSGKQYPDLAAFYFDANPDVQKAYETDPQAKTMTPEEYVQFHYREFGSKPTEKRKGYYEELVAKPATYEGGGGASGGMAQDIPRMARGGLSSLAVLGGAAGGGQFDLGSYSDGGRLLRGPGDGVSDSIPATIGGKRPARLADGEFVVPARIVSELGNGSTEAGARKLYAMMDRVQRARSKSMGKGKVAKNTRADKYLPA